jgi:DNA-binding beta-propeller fold protein YncE
MEYDRRDNTPPQARLTEPKRSIGGNQTKAEMLCGVYIDPKTLDTYVVNNDTQNWLAVFSKSAQGNVEPDRYLAVPHGAFGIAVDEGRQEMYITIQHNNAVIVYRKTASGEEEPLREIFGDDTELEDPHGITLDSRRSLIFVSNHGHGRYRERGGGQLAIGRDSEGENRSARQFLVGSGYFDPPSITVYSQDAEGNTVPLRIIEGPKTQLNWPAHMAVDEERGELYVANDMDDSILVFRVDDQGDVAPRRLIRGPKTGLKNPAGLALDLKNKEVWAANMGNHSATVYPILAQGDVPPLRTIRSGAVDEPSLLIVNPGGVGYDSRREEILVPN